MPAGAAFIAKAQLSWSVPMAKRRPHVLDLSSQDLSPGGHPDMFASHGADEEALDAGMLRGRKNNAPVAKNDVNGKDRVIADGGTGEGDPSAKGNVLSNDTDKDRDSLKVLKPGVIDGDFGTLKLSANGKWIYILDDDNEDVAALEPGEKLLDTFKYTVSDGHGGKDTATLKIKIEGNADSGPQATIQLDSVTADNIINSSEASGTVNITGTVGGDVKNGDIVTVTVNGINYQGTVSSGHFSIGISGTQLSVDGDRKIEASVTTGTGSNTTTAATSKEYAVDMTPPTASISVNNVTSDNIVNNSESGGNVTITGTVGGDVKAGDIVTLTVNGVEYTGSVAAGKFSIAVAGSNLVADADKIIEASVTTSDGAGNSTIANDSQSYSVDTTLPTATLAIDSITADNLVNRVEAAGNVLITGTVGGDVKNGDAVTVVVNGNNYTGLVASNAFSIEVLGKDLYADADKTIQATVSVSDSAGNIGTASNSLFYQIGLNLDVSTMAATYGFVIQGDDPIDGAGWSVSSAGDVNGDGYDDIIVGARRAATDAGEAYVIFGRASGFGTLIDGRRVIDLTTLSATDGFIIQGDEPGDLAGNSVSSAGDINGDGFDDLIVGAPQGDDAGSNAGEAYVVFGGAANFGSLVGDRRVLDLSMLNVNQGFIIQADKAGDWAGWSVRAAGDVNGDGYDDIIIGAMFGDDGGSSAGEAYVMFGRAGSFGVIVDDEVRIISYLAGSGSAMAPDRGFIIQGDAAGDMAGCSVSSAGDVNGDGFDDLIVGAYLGQDAGQFAGEAYVIFGTAAGFGSVDGTGRRVVDLTTLTESQGFIIQAASPLDNAARSVSSAGDVNGDGYDDVIIGAAAGDDGGTNSGEAYVVFGKASGFGELIAGRRVVNLATFDSSQGFMIQGDAEGDGAGRSVSAAGDINGDGFGDIIVGAPFADRLGSEDAGKAYVIFGTANGFGFPVGGRQVLDLSSVSAKIGFAITGYFAGGEVGSSVSAAGDVNKDGFDDLIVGAPKNDEGGTDSGAAYIIFGGAYTGNTPIVRTGTTAAEMLIGGLGADKLTGGGGADVMIGGAGNDTIGVTGTAFRKIDGGNGYDTLRMDGASDVFNFANIRNTAIESIEAIDMGVTGSQQLKLSKLDIFHLSDDTTSGITKLTVLGGASDTVSTSDSGWTANGTTTIGSNSYKIFDNGHARLLVDSDMALGGGLLL